MTRDLVSPIFGIMLGIVAVAVLSLARLSLIPQTPSELRLGIHPPSPLFLTAGTSPVRGEEMIVRAMLSAVAERLTDFADPPHPRTLFGMVRAEIFIPTGRIANLQWFEWAIRLAPYDLQLRRDAFFWSYHEEGPAAAERFLQEPLFDQPDNGLLWLDLAHAASRLTETVDEPRAAQAAVRAWECRNLWKGWEIADVASLAVILANEEKRVTFMLKQHSNSGRARLLLKELSLAADDTRNRLNEIRR